MHFNPMLTAQVNSHIFAPSLRLRRYLSVCISFTGQHVQPAVVAVAANSLAAGGGTSGVGSAPGPLLAQPAMVAGPAIPSRWAAARQHSASSSATLGFGRRYGRSAGAAAAVRSLPEPGLGVRSFSCTIPSVVTGLPPTAVGSYVGGSSPCEPVAWTAD